jgi:hypothetical protein
MDSVFPGRGWVLLLVMLAAGAAGAVRADALGAVTIVRAGGCGGRAALAPPLRHSRALDELAAQWAQGAPLVELAAHQGYATGAVSGLHVRSGGAALSEKLSSSHCADRFLRACPGCLARACRDRARLAPAGAGSVRAPAPGCAWHGAGGQGAGAFGARA